MVLGTISPVPTTPVWGVVRAGGGGAVAQCCQVKGIISIGVGFASIYWVPCSDDAGPSGPVEPCDRHVAVLVSESLTRASLLVQVR